MYSVFFFFYSKLIGSLHTPKGVNDVSELTLFINHVDPDTDDCSSEESSVIRKKPAKTKKSRKKNPVG